MVCTRTVESQEWAEFEYLRAQESQIYVDVGIYMQKHFNNKCQPGKCLPLEMRIVKAYGTIIWAKYELKLLKMNMIFSLR